MGLSKGKRKIALDGGREFSWLFANEIIKTNLNSVFYCTQEALPHMINQKEGCIINISSIWGETGGACEVAYSTTKAAINGLTKALAKEVISCSRAKISGLIKVSPVLFKKLFGAKVDSLPS